MPDADFHCLPAPPLGASGYRFPLRGGHWLHMLRRLQPDLIEAGDPYRLAWVALAAGQRLDVPVIGFYHSDVPRLVARRLGPSARTLAEHYIRRLYRQFDAVCAPSRVMARQLEGLGIPRTLVQPLGVDVQRFHPRHADPKLRMRLGIGRDTRLLVFAGRAAREKNIDLLLATAQALGNRYHLLLIGPGMPHTIARNVTTVPHYLPAPQLAGHLAACDALIHAGDQETFGLVVLEAMASGLPVIGTHHGALPELVVPGTGVLTPDVTRDGLVDATPALQDRTLEEIIAFTSDRADLVPVFNNSGQHWNHSFFWNSLSPKGGGMPGKLEVKIVEDFGSVVAFKESFKAAATGQFGSGWAWLILGPDGKLKTTKTANAASPLSSGEGKPLLTLDVWEHSYYVDFRNRRPDYVTNFLDNLANFEFADANLG
jgi:alpha-1,6-mannosyltransferase